MKQAAGVALDNLAGESKTFDKHELGRRIIAEVASGLNLEVDEDELGDALDLLNLLPCVLRVAATDSQVGDTYGVYQVVSAPDGELLVFEDLMEEGALVRIGTTETYEAACRIIGEHASSCLGQNGYLFFDGIEVDLEASPERDEAFWTSAIQRAVQPED